MRPYEPQPRYPVVGGTVLRGWAECVSTLPRGPMVLAVDGPVIAPWTAVRAALAAHGVVEFVDMRACLSGREKILARADTPRLHGDPDFARLAELDLADLLEDVPRVAARAGTVAVLGPGAALARPDVLWYADLPKRYAEQAVAQGTGRNLGQPKDAGPGTYRQLFYVDWPVLDRHRTAIADRVDLWLDLQGEQPAAVSGPTLRASTTSLAHRPFRTRPTFNTTSWGGHWAQRELGMNPGARNTALGYELIAPESGVLFGPTPDRQVEIPFQQIVAWHPGVVLGDEIHRRFGLSFPIRFDYLDTVDGGDLSVHCHPRPGYMRDVFGWPYPQHETYYVLVGGPSSRIFLGLRAEADIGEFHRRAHAAEDQGVPLDIGRYVQSHPATPHQLFLIPAGTPHGSGRGNVVLEVSATPYLYSLRFYDWLRRDHAGARRPVHVEHAFANLDPARRGDLVPDRLIPRPRTVRSGAGFREEVLGAAPELFFDVHRTVLEGTAPVPDDTTGRFHVLTVVEGEGVLLESGAGEHSLAYAETLVVPAAVGPYRLSRQGHGTVRVLKALVRPEKP